MSYFEWESDKYLGFLEHCADVLDASFKTESGQKFRFHLGWNVKPPPQWPPGPILDSSLTNTGLPSWHSGKESTSQCRRWQEIRVRTQGQEDPQEKEMATHSSIFPWEVSWTEEPGRLQSMGLQRVGHDWAYTHTHLARLTPLWFSFHSTALFYIRDLGIHGSWYVKGWGWDVQNQFPADTEGNLYLQSCTEFMSWE